MRSIGFSNQHSLLVQESHLAKNSILSGFDLLIKSIFDQDRDGYFYSAFFNLSIGMERMLKLVVVVDHMLRHNYQSPTTKELRAYGHDIQGLFGACDSLHQTYRPSAARPERLDVDNRLLNFLSRFAVSTRYFNFDELAKAEKDRVAMSPLYEWWEICRDLYEEFTPAAAREKSALSLLYWMDAQRIHNGYTSLLDVTGHPMTVFDVYHRQKICERASRLAVWRMVETFRPVHFLLWGIVKKSAEYEVAQGIVVPVVPHFEDFFYFFLASRADVMKRKSWLRIFNS